eukprot:8134066-Pyramimonas_sp.AAC.1
MSRKCYRNAMANALIPNSPGPLLLARLRPPSSPRVLSIPHGPDSTPHGPESTPRGPDSTPRGPESTPHSPDSTPRGPESTP